MIPPAAGDRPPGDVVNLVHARYLLAATLDDHRAIVGQVSRDWIRRETERRVAVGRLPEALRRHPLVAAEGGPDADRRLNTNRLPKLEPVINAYVLAGAILYGARLYGDGTPDPAQGVRCAEIENDLIVAAMIHATVSHADRLSAALPEDRRVVDDAYVAERFGPGVARHLAVLRGHLAAFEGAHAAGAAADLAIPPAYANAVAALMAARLRLAARAAGDGIFGLLDAAQRAELAARGIDTGPPGAPFPERPYLARDRAAAVAAAALPGVDAATIRTPVVEQLVRNVAYVLDGAVPPSHLVGRYGAAVHQFHTVLPLMYRYSPVIRRVAAHAGQPPCEVEGPYALGTLHLTGLEVTRYLHNVRRKGFGTGAGHSFVVSSRAGAVLYGHRSVPILAGCDCHDVVEDGGFSVTGYDQSLELFAARFGAPLAALVAEVTDSITKSDGPTKAAAFLDQPSLVLPDELYNVGQYDELRAVATDPDVPYTLAGAVIKLADTGTTYEEGLLDPDLMEGVWRHSGARVHWDLHSKGAILRPLWERLAIELRLAAADPFYHRRPGALPAPTLARVKDLMAWSLEMADRYAVQNLALLAGEHGLDGEARSALVAVFLEDRDGEPGPGADPGKGSGAGSDGGDDAGFAAALDARLDDARLDPEVRRRGLAATYRLLPDGTAERDLGKLLAYRRAAARRRALRRELGIAPPPPARLTEAVRRLDRVMGGEDPAGGA